MNLKYEYMTVYGSLLKESNGYFRVTDISTDTSVNIYTLWPPSKVKREAEQKILETYYSTRTKDT